MKIFFLLAITAVLSSDMNAETPPENLTQNNKRDITVNTEVFAGPCTDRVCILNSRFNMESYCPDFNCLIPVCKDALLLQGQSCYMCPYSPNFRVSSDPPEDDCKSLHPMTTKTVITSVNIFWNFCTEFYKPINDPCYTCKCVVGYDPSDDSFRWSWNDCPKMICVTPLCDDPVKVEGHCCLQCPNGPNCTYQNATILLNETRSFPGGVECQCIQINSSASPEAVCKNITTPTTPTTTNAVQTNISKPIGVCGVNTEEYLKTCYSGVLSQIPWYERRCPGLVCTIPPCVDGVKLEGQSCYTCLYGLNCLGSLSHADEFCLNIYRTTTNIQCNVAFTDNYFCGENNKPINDTCHPCECSMKYSQANGQFSWDWHCPRRICPTLNCVDAVRLEGDCCEQCPNGPNCKYQNVTMLLNETKSFSGGVECHCSQINSLVPPEADCKNLTMTTFTTTANTALYSTTKLGTQKHMNTTLKERT